jgi:protein gp37
MSDDSKIEWTDATWNPVRGCSRVSDGCRHCYAERVAARFSGPGMPYEGLIKFGKPSSVRDPRWSGEVRMVPEHLAAPLRWRRPRRVFVNSMSDLFHESLPDSAIDRVFAVMMVSSLHATRGGHTFQSLTKRAKRMREYLTDPGTQERVARAAGTMMEDGDGWFDAIAFRKEGLAHPLIWLGASVENQAAADERIPELLRTPAAVRWLSCEPLLGPVEIRGERDRCGDCDPCLGGAPCSVTGTHLNALHPDGINWIVAGCESGPGARPCDVAWLRSLRDQCAAAGVAFFLKQAVEGGDTPIVTTNGERAPAITAGPDSHRKAGGIIGLPYLDGRQHAEMPEERRRG